MVAALSCGRHRVRGDRVALVLFYRTQRKKGDGATSRNKTTPLVFRTVISITITDVKA